MSHTKEIKYIISEPPLVANKATLKIFVKDKKIRKVINRADGDVHLYIFTHLLM